MLNLQSDFSLNYLTNEISLTNLEAISEILTLCFQRYGKKRKKNSSSVFAKYFCNHYNYTQRVVFAPVTLLAKSVAGQ